MTYVLQGKEPVWQQKPDNVLSASVCVTGFPPQNGDSCDTKNNELFWTKSQPSNSKYVTKDVWIHPDTGLPLKPGESTDGLQLQSKTVLTDPFTNDYCVDCARPLDPEGKTVYERYTVPVDGSSAIQNSGNNDQ
jgi:hypothetical protein